MNRRLWIACLAFVAIGCTERRADGPPRLGVVKQEAFVSDAGTTDQPVTSWAPAVQGQPSVAFNGNSYLIVWADYRRGAGDIWGAFFNGSAVSPEKGFIICDAPAHQYAPRVESDGSNFFVAWTDQRDVGQGENIYGTQVTSGGVVTTPNGFAIASQGVNENSPSITKIGASSYAVAWTEVASTNNGNIQLRRIDVASGSSSPAAVTVAGTAANEGFPAVTLWDPGTVAVSWMQTNVVQFRRMNFGSGVQDSAPVPVSSASNAFAPVGIASNGSSSGVVLWTRHYFANPSWFSSLVVSRINGATPSAEQTWTTTVGPSDGWHHPEVGWDGSTFRILVARGALPMMLSGYSGSLYHATVTTGGSQSALPLPEVADRGYPGALAASAGTATYVWSDPRSGDGTDVMAMRSNAIPSAALTGTLISRADNAQTAPAVGFDGTQFVLAWSDNRVQANLRDIYAMRVATSGAKVDTVAVSLSSEAGNEQSVQIAGGLGGALVQFQSDGSALNSRHIRFTLIDSDGGVRSPPGTLVHPFVDARRVSLNPSFDGTNYLVSFGAPYDLRIARVTPAGTVLDNGGVFVADAGLFNTLEAAIASAGTRTLATFNAADTAVEATSIFVDTSSGVAPSAAIIPHNDGGYDLQPRIATNGADFFVAWVDGVAREYRGRLVRADGGQGPVQLIDFSLPSANPPPAVPAFDGRYFAVVYEATPDGGSSPQQIRARWFDALGLPLPGGPFVVHEGNTREVRGAAAAGDGRGHLLVAYSEFSPAAQSKRVFHRVLRYHRDQGEACAADSECPSGFCVDGVCCDSACGDSAANDCQVCSQALGASANGSCTPLPSTTQCRAASADPADVCDAPERCTGSSGDCPADIAAAQGTSCRGTQGRACDAEELCDGTSKQCPPDAVLASDATCRASQGVCDVEEKCDGASASCPADALRGSSEQCQAPTSCTEPTFCSGSSAECPPLVPKPEGTPCPDAVDGVCQGGTCVSATRVSRYALISCSASGGGAALLAALVAAATLLRLRRGAVMAGLALLLVAGAAEAADRKVKLTFLGLTPGAGVSPAELEAVSSFVQSQVAALEVYSVIGAAEVRAMLGAERQKQLLGCDEDSSSCIQELAGALDADRGISGDVSVVSGNTIMNLTLLNLRESKTLKRVARRVEGEKAFDAILDVAPGAVIELVSEDPAIDKSQMKIQRGFGGIVAGLRADSDVAGRGIAPGVTAEISSKRFGGALAVFYGQAPGVRAEGRFYPVTLGIVRPYVGAGATVFAPDVAARVSLGVAVALGNVQIFGDGAYERSLTPDATGAGATLYLRDAVLLGIGAGWAF